MEYGIINAHIFGMVLLIAGTSTEVLGVITILVGFALRYWVNRRRFNRRNGAGLQTFNSFEQKVTVTLFERVMKIIGLAIILLGIFFFLAGYAEKGNTPKQTTKSHHNIS